MSQVSPKIELDDRTLWFDGSTSVSEEQLMRMVAEGQNLQGVFVKEMDPLIEEYNQFVSPDQRIQVKTKADDIVARWTIPDEYKNLDVEKYVRQKLKELKIDSLDYLSSAHLRVETELELYEQLGLLDVLRTLIYVINTLQNNNIVWGVGRGSSVSSFILYLIGVHDVDSIEYDLDFKDFLRLPE